MPILAAALAASLLGSPALAASAPAPYRAALSRHPASAERLEQLRFAFVDELCFRVDASARPVGRALTPEQLDAALTALEHVPISRAPSAAAGRPARIAVPLGSSPSPKILDRTFDGAAARMDSGGGVEAPDSDDRRSPSRAAEPPFDARWSKIRADLRDPKRRARGLKILRKSLVQDAGSETGMNPDAPEALRVLTRTIDEGRGGREGARALDVALSTAAALTPERKAALARALRSPLIIYIALSRSESSHFLDSQLYFRRMESLLAADGMTLSAYLRETDPKGRDAAAFLLRVHAYDALIAYFNRRPAEAGALAPFLFPDGRPREIRARASQLEGLLTQLAAHGRRSGALAQFLHALEDRAGKASGPTARRIALFLKVNEPILPRAERARIDALASILPPGLLEGSGLTPPEPFDLWPADQWTFVLHFASTDSYRGWAGRFQSRGYAKEPDAKGITLAKDFGGVKVRLRGRLYPGDKEGFLRGAVKARFLADAARDLRDPAIQGVMFRNHKQFHTAALFERGATPGKLILDGACRSGWDLQILRRRCPTCSFVVNTGTGKGDVNDDAALAVIEGLARGEEWREIGEEWSRLNPNAASVQGPWTPPYAEALALLIRAESRSNDTTTAGPLSAVEQERLK